MIPVQVGQESLDLLKNKLGITSSVRDVYLQTILDGTKNEVKNIQGLDLDENRTDHVLFLVDYAAWRYQTRGEDGAMPQHLYWRMKNLMVGGKNGRI